MGILLTGATGYIGSRLACALANEGHSVHVLVRTSSDRKILAACEGKLCFHEYDGSYESIAAIFSHAPIALVCHVAASVSAKHSGEYIAPMLAANITLGTHLLEAMQQHGVKHFINTGSYWQYDSDGRMAPNTLYAASKQAFEAVVDYYVVKAGIKAVTLALFDVYGPDDKRGKFLNHVLTAMHSGDPIRATAGEQEVLFVHVDDVCRGYVQAIDWLASQPSAVHARFGLGATERFILREVVEKASAMMDRPAAVQWGALPYPAYQIMKPAHLPSLPGWVPKISLEMGIKELLGSLEGQPA